MVIYILLLKCHTKHDGQNIQHAGNKNKISGLDPSAVLHFTVASMPQFYIFDKKLGYKVQLQFGNQGKIHQG